MSIEQFLEEVRKLDNIETMRAKQIKIEGTEIASIYFASGIKFQIFFIGNDDYIAAYKKSSINDEDFLSATSLDEMLLLMKEKLEN